MRTAIACVVGLATCLFQPHAWADEQIVPLAVGGDWAAAAHHESMTAPPDVCIASNIAAGFALRADKSGLQIRVINQKWSLPAGVAGEVKIDVGSFHKSFDIDDNTDDSVNAELSVADALALFSAMDNAAAMSVTAGSAKPVVVSLTGSTRATNAFRTCAGLNSSGAGGGTNPFASKP